MYPQKKPFDADAVRTALDKRHGQSRRSSQPSESEHINNISQSPKEEPRPTSRFGRQSQSRLETLEKTSMDIFAAVFRQTKMGSYFSSPVDPPEFLRVAFPDDDDLRCVSADSENRPLMPLPVPSLPHVFALHHRRQGGLQPLDTIRRAHVPLPDRRSSTQYRGVEE